MKFSTIATSLILVLSCVTESYAANGIFGSLQTSPNCVIGNNKCKINTMLPEVSVKVKPLYESYSIPCIKSSDNDNQCKYFMPTPAPWNGMVCERIANGKPNNITNPGQYVFCRAYAPVNELIDVSTKYNSSYGNLIIFSATSVKQDGQNKSTEGVLGVVLKCDGGYWYQGDIGANPTVTGLSCLYDTHGKPIVNASS